MNTTINRLLNDYEGKVYSYYVKSETYKVVGIVLAKEEVSQKNAEQYFETQLSKTVKVPKTY